MSEKHTEKHTIEPFFPRGAHTLVLGSFPSVRSRESGFYYGHPQNRFWRVLAGVFDCAAPQSIEEKKELLRSHGIALWDVIAECDITGSSDSSIRAVVPNDIATRLERSDIARIFTNGETADKLYRKYILPLCGREARRLPSTSPANAAWSLERLMSAWHVVAEG